MVSEMPAILIGLLVVIIAMLAYAFCPADQPLCVGNRAVMPFFGLLGLVGIGLGVVAWREDRARKDRGNEPSE